MDTRSPPIIFERAELEALERRARSRFLEGLFAGLAIGMLLGIVIRSLAPLFD